ncbi:hypothetical protein ET495_13600 [Xylanimonas allomyrinae]|uniref:Polyketide antibiotic transporter n=1 Tax=Xylanimonas allomyrinae TaxID=2509459 RepID=A0A4P6EN27_9MICO|nr:hypothetical protein [Xylanimonas allomyrinae]QAY64084.1 hypothetical protein ET495_13600 [Xylanimonas allomyrinae]
MTTTAPSSAGPARTTTTPRAPRGATLTGTGLLLRFALRRDRVRLLVWLCSIAALYAGGLTEYLTLDTDAQARETRAALMRTPAMIAMAGPGFGLDDYRAGPAVANELILWVLLALAVMSILQIARHTRTEEESSRSELVRAGVVGRHAPAVAAMLQLVIAQVAIAVVSGAVLAAQGLDVGGSFAMSFSIALGALVFGAVALVTSQLMEHGRGAVGLAFAALGVAYMVRVVGDLQQLQGSAFSWFSPIAWVQQTRVFVDFRAWPLLLCLALTAVLVVVSSSLGSRRDFGAGLVAVRAGRADAPASLRSPIALAWAQQRTTLFWWALGFGLMWLGTGGVLDAVPDMVDAVGDNPLYDALFSDPDNLVRSFVVILGLYVATASAAYAVAAFTRARGEEEAGRVEYALAGPVARGRWLASHLAVVAGGTAVVMLSGVALLAAGAAAVGVDEPTFGDLMLLGVLYLPALAVLIGFAAALFAWVPRLTGLAWALMAFMFVVGMFATLFRLPGWVQRISPFFWVDDPLAGDVSATHVAGLCLVAAVLVAAAFVGFRRRDVPTV